MSCEKPIFSLVHGRHFSGEHFKYLQEELRKLGSHSIAPTFKVEDPSLSVECHAQDLVKAEEESGGKEFIRFGHSWGVNLVVREVTANVKMLVFDAGVFHPSSLPDISPDNLPLVEHSALYEIIKKDPDHNLKGLAGDTFFQDVEDPTVKQWAIDLLRPHPRREAEPLLGSKPNIPSIYIKATMDNTVTSSSQTEMAESWGVDKIELLQSDHGNMVSRPSELAALLVKNAAFVGAS